MVLPAFRLAVLSFALSVALAPFAHAVPTEISFTAVVGTSNDIDLDNVFGEGAGANLQGQVITGSVSIDPAPLVELSSSGPACYGDFGAGAVSVSFTLNGVTSTTVSTGTAGYFGGRSGGSVSISDLADGGWNYVAVGAASPDGMVEQSIGVLFDDATLFSAYGGGDKAVAVGSLDSIGDGAGLVKGGITFMSPNEHLDATILTIDDDPQMSTGADSIPEPSALALVGLALAGMRLARRKAAA